MAVAVYSSVWNSTSGYFHELQARTILKTEHPLQYLILYLVLLIVESFRGGVSDFDNNVRKNSIHL